MSQALAGNPCIIRVNQIGYRPGDKKIAFLTEYRNTIEIRRADESLVMSLKPVPRGSAGAGGVDPASGDTLWEADFSGLSRSGSYYIQAGKEKTPIFEIGRKVYSGLAAGIIKMFYYQRCGCPGTSADYIEGIFAHPPCHTGMAKYYEPNDTEYGTVEADVSGGWHDAGDYGRYVTPAAKAVADLLMAAEHFPSVAEFQYGGPANILAEVCYEIEWMLKMQNPDTGGVYHKVTTQAHANIAWLPEQDTCQLYLAPVSAQATGDFAAVTAYAGRFFKESEPAFADKCLNAALKAWKWLTSHPEANGYVDPDFFRTGKYGDSCSLDERFWAAVELYNATGGQEYLEYIEQSELPAFGLGWGNVGSYALASFVLSNSSDAGGSLHEEMKNRFVNDTEKLMETRRRSGYGIAIGRFAWGSNMDVANTGMHFILAHRMTGNPVYLAAAKDQLDYLLGRNAMDLSYVTLFGEKASCRPHHRPSIVRGRAVPGMLVGGPYGDISKLTRDPASGLFSERTPPAKCYADKYESFSSNEICIYWNSPLAYILASLLD